MTAVRRWLAGASLRTRLVAVLVAVLLVTFAAVGTITAFALHAFLLGRLDEQLAGAGDRYAVFLERNTDNSLGRDPDVGDSPGQAIGTFGARLVAGRVAQAAVVSVPPRTVRVDADEARALAALPLDARPRSRDLDELGDYRLAARRGADGDVLITGLPLAGLNETVARLVLVESVVFVATAALAAVAVRVLVGATLRPLRRVTATAQQVSQLPLGSGEVAVPERVPTVDARTEVGQVGAAVNQMLAHVHAALRERHATEDRLRRFLADASHELRTPLASIRAHTELALHTGDPEPVGASLRRVQAESLRLTALVDDLLLLARLDTGRPLDSGTVDLSLLTVDAAADARVAGPEHRWVLRLPNQPVLVAGDGHRLAQVLANLLGNARDHTPPGTQVTVELTRRGASAELAVTDDGPGIPADLQPELFERFTRGERSRSRGAGSTGLGLAIVAAVIAAHHGSVSVHSVPGRTVFVVRLPLAAD